MERIRIARHVRTQHCIFMWGQLVGFCDERPNMPVNFLAGSMDILDDEEKADVIEYVADRVASVRRTRQTQEAWRVIDRRHSCGQ